VTLGWQAKTIAFLIAVKIVTISHCFNQISNYFLGCCVKLSALNLV